MWFNCKSALKPLVKHLKIQNRRQTAKIKEVILKQFIVLTAEDLYMIY
jgi:hypothetical protein